jgi:ribosome-associated heat shock protein Hsp15
MEPEFRRSPEYTNSPPKCTVPRSVQTSDPIRDRCYDSRIGSKDVRLDKWLQVARVFKTRTQATRACTLGRVSIDRQPAKPHRSLQIGDRLEIRFGDWTRILVVRELHDKPVAKALAREMYEDLSPPRPRLDLVDRIMREGAPQREPGTGRPTKRERRKIDQLRREGEGS